jgi:hypothetical protein
VGIVTVDTVVPDPEEAAVLPSLVVGFGFAVTGRVATVVTPPEVTAAVLPLSAAAGGVLTVTVPTDIGGVVFGVVAGGGVAGMMGGATGTTGTTGTIGTIGTTGAITGGVTVTGRRSANVVAGFAMPVVKAMDAPTAITVTTVKTPAIAGCCFAYSI